MKALTKKQMEVLLHVALAQRARPTVIERDSREDAALRLAIDKLANGLQARQEHERRRRLKRGVSPLLRELFS
jgi:hypothetical protein